ncbi:MAG: CHAD domain-containing protein [Candidatus Poribacteria bacterium]|nr:CHAD domain-containing protein [Candidatus Poribacteria bacterium]
MAKPQKITGLNPKQSFRENARTILPQKVEEVYTWEQFIQDPEKREELHNMRISIKRLRYTMEFFAINYDKHFTDLIETIIDLQDVLGDVHDSDVVLEVLTNYKENCQSSELPGVDTLIARTRETRNADYQAFLERWEQLSAAGFKQKLLAIIAL